MYSPPPSRAFLDPVFKRGTTSQTRRCFPFPPPEDARLEPSTCLEDRASYRVNEKTAIWWPWWRRRQLFHLACVYGLLVFCCLSRRTLLLCVLSQISGSSGSCRETSR